MEKRKERTANTSSLEHPIRKEQKRGAKGVVRVGGETAWPRRNRKEKSLVLDGREVERPGSPKFTRGEENGRPKNWKTVFEANVG